MFPLAILYRDEHLVVIHKPAGLLMHRSPISRDSVFVLQTLRDQIGQRVYPIHRLDRATSGVLAFGLTPEVARIVAGQFEDQSVDKEYLALVRGWVNNHGRIDHPVADEEGNGQFQQAITDYRCLQKIELPVAVDRYASARYSLVGVSPQTGRRQQIRKHFKHISHHMIGDTTHGNGKHNRFFREHYAIHRLMLTSWRLCLDHPVSRDRLCFNANSEPEWEKLFAAFCWDYRVVKADSV
jgi:tRNA pseudouridine65 synthase